MTESFAELFEQSQSLAKLKPGAIVSGIVVEIRPDVVVINAGLKSEGIVPIEQFRNEAGELEVELGDEVKVALDAIEDGFGETKLSREKAKRSMVWDELEQAFDLPVVGTVSWEQAWQNKPGRGRFTSVYFGLLALTAVVVAAAYANGFTFNKLAAFNLDWLSNIFR